MLKNSMNMVQEILRFKDDPGLQNWIPLRKQNNDSKLLIF